MKSKKSPSINKTRLDSYLAKKRYVRLLDIAQLFQLEKHQEHELLTKIMRQFWKRGLFLCLKMPFEQDYNIIDRKSLHFWMPHDFCASKKKVHSCVNKSPIYVDSLCPTDSINDFYQPLASLQWSDYIVHP